MIEKNCNFSTKHSFHEIKDNFLFWHPVASTGAIIKSISLNAGNPFLSLP